MRFLLPLLFVSLIFPTFAGAAVNIQNFEHTSSYSFENMNGARVLDSYLPIEQTLLLGAGYSFDRNPLVIENLGSDQRVGVVIKSYQSLHLTAGYRLSDTLTFGFDTAVVRTGFENGDTDTSLSDSRLSVDYTFYQRGKWALGLQGLLNLPTGQGRDYLSDSGLGEQLLLSLSHEWQPLSVTLNAGYLQSTNALDSVDPRLDYRKRLVTEIGAIHPFSDQWSGIAEFHRYWTLPLNHNLNPNELYVGARDQWSESLALYAGASVGTFDRVSSNEWRVLAGFKWAPTFAKKEKPPEPVKPVCEPVAPPDLKFTLHFENDRFSLDDRAEVARMEGKLEELKENIEVVDVIGHTSITGTDAYNLRLSIRRAATVRSFLVHEGETGEGIHAAGEGSRELLDPAMTEAAHRKNRRVEIIIHQKKSLTKCL